MNYIIIDKYTGIQLVDGVFSTKSHAQKYADVTEDSKVVPYDKSTSNTTINSSRTTLSINITNSHIEGNIYMGCN